MKNVFEKMATNKAKTAIFATCTLFTVTSIFTLPNILMAKQDEVRISAPEKLKKASYPVSKVEEENKSQEELTSVLPNMETKSLESVSEQEKISSEPKKNEVSQEKSEGEVPIDSASNVQETSSSTSENRKEDNLNQEEDSTTTESISQEETPSNSFEEVKEDVSNQEDNSTTSNVPQQEEKEETNVQEESTATTPKVENQQENVTESKEEPSTQDSQEDLIQLIKNAYQKTKNANSAYYIAEQSGLYQEKLNIKYNKEQNREIILSDLGEEYLEGMPGRYTDDWITSSYYNQSRWRRETGTTEWESMGRLHSTFGISILRFLSNIKEVKEYNIKGLVYRTFAITVDKESANIAGEAQFNKVNMFKKDIQFDISIDRNGYIILVDCKWDHSVLSDSIPNISYMLRAGYFNETDVSRPKDLRNITIPDYAKQEELTSTKKREIAKQIEAAYEKTMNVNSATYKTNAKEVEFNKDKNEALIRDQNGVTYYKGTDGMYTESDYVTPSHHQDSWTKELNSNTWKQNVRKHTAFNPKELYFLAHIFDVLKVEKQNDLTTYTVTVLKYDANVAYRYATNQSSDMFDNNITFKVTLDNKGYIRELHIQQNDYHYDLEMNQINTTNIVQPTDLN